eukprot:702722_1
MAQLKIKIHINEDLERTHHFDKTRDRTAFIDINRDDAQLVTLSEDIPRAFRAYKDIKSKVRDNNSKIHFFSYTEGQVEIDNNDDLMTEIDFVYPESSSEDDGLDDTKYEPRNKYVNIRAIFMPIHIQHNHHEYDEDPQDQREGPAQIQHKQPIATPPPNNIQNELHIPHAPPVIQLSQDVREHQGRIDGISGIHHDMQDHKYNDIPHANPHKKFIYHDFHHNDNSPIRIQSIELNICPYRWQIRLDSDEDILPNEGEVTIEFDGNHYWKWLSLELSLYYEQRYNKLDTYIPDKQLFSDSFHTIRRRTRFIGNILFVSHAKGYGYVSPNYTQNNIRGNKLCGIFFHFEQAFRDIYLERYAPIPCEQGQRVSYEVKLFTKVRNDHRRRKTGFRAINLQVLPPENAINDLYNAPHMNDVIKQQAQKPQMQCNDVQQDDIKCDNDGNNAQRLKGPVVHVLKDKETGYVKDSRYGLTAFRFSECRGFEPCDLRQEIDIEYELRNTNGKTCAVNICLNLLPYQWHTYDEEQDEWIMESVANAEYLENKDLAYDTAGNCIDRTKQKRSHRFTKPILQMDKDKHIGFVESNYNKGIGLIFSFNECNFDFDPIQLCVGDEVVYSLVKFEANGIIYWKVINVEHVPKLKRDKMIVWKWRKDETDVYKEYNDQTISVVLENLQTYECIQLDTARSVTKISDEECIDQDSLHDVCRYVRRFLV